MKFYVFLLCALVCLAVSESAAIEPPKSCKYDGKAYAVGEVWWPTACRRCTCEAPGEVVCYSIACLQVYCEGQYYVKGKCCPVCPGISI